MFYDRFLELCESRGVAPSAAATAMGIDKSNVSKWKSRGLTPRGDALKKIAQYFDVGIGYLLEETTDTEFGKGGIDDDGCGADELTGLSPTLPDTIENAPTHGGGDLSLSLDAMLDMLKNEEGIMFDGMDYSEEAITLLYQSIMNVKETARMLAERDRGKKNENNKPREDG